ncbi:MAG TPA: hypothetical protein VLF89_05835, partial [Candidatus Saccharimonadales bacterium]|nr:hypothetical protein [Candidatus Saccharimonadales bacterium]
VIQFFLLYLYIWTVFPITHFKREQFDYITNYKKVSVYFFVATIIPIIFFFNRLLPFVQNFSILPLVALLLFYIISLLLYKKTKPLYRDEFVKDYYPAVRSMAAMDNRYLLSKSFDIFFQETLFIIWYSLLKDIGISMTYMIFISIFITAFTHVCMFFFVKESPQYVWYLTIASSSVAVFFPFLILTVAYGFFYTFIIHYFVGFIMQGVGLDILKAKTKFVN